MISPFENYIHFWMKSGGESVCLGVAYVPQLPPVKSFLLMNVNSESGPGETRVYEVLGVGIRSQMASLESTVSRFLEDVGLGRVSGQQMPQYSVFVREVTNTAEAPKWLNEAFPDADEASQ